MCVRAPLCVCATVHEGAKPKKGGELKITSYTHIQSMNPILTLALESFLGINFCRHLRMIFIPGYNLCCFWDPESGCLDQKKIIQNGKFVAS